MGADTPKARSTGKRDTRLRALERSLLVAAALALPALCLGQETGSEPGGGASAAELPGGGVPGVALGFSGAGVTGLNPLPAEYTNYGVAAGVGETDNVNLSSTDRKSQTLAATTLFFDLIRSGSRLDLSGTGNFADTDYLQGAYRNQVLGRFDGLANLTLWTNHLRWLLRDDYGDSQVNVLQSLTPVNVQRVNVFTTGPQLTLQPTVSSFVQLQGLYSRSTWQDSPFNGNAETGTATIGHQFTPLSSISLVGQVEEERFDDRSINRNYQLREYYAHYALKGARTAVDLQGGLAQANDTGSWNSTPLVRVSLTRDLSPFSTVSLSGGREYRSAVGSFTSLASGTAGGIPVGPATQTSENALRTYGNTSWTYRRLRTSVSVLGGWERDAYAVSSQLNTDRSDVGLNLGRQLAPRLSAHLTATVDRWRYGGQGFTENFGTAGAGLVYRPGSWVVLYGRYDHQFRHSSGVAGQGLGYDENRVYIMIGYYPHFSGTGLPAQSGMGGGGALP